MHVVVKMNSGVCGEEVALRRPNSGRCNNNIVEASWLVPFDLLTKAAVSAETTPSAIVMAFADLVHGLALKENVVVLEAVVLPGELVAPAAGIEQGAVGNPPFHDHHPCVLNGLAQQCYPSMGFSGKLALFAAGRKGTLDRDSDARSRNVGNTPIAVPRTYGPRSLEPRCQTGAEFRTRYGPEIMAFWRTHAIVVDDLGVRHLGEREPPLGGQDCVHVLGRVGAHKEGRTNGHHSVVRVPRCRWTLSRCYCRRRPRVFLGTSRLLLLGLVKVRVQSRKDHLAILMEFL